MANAKCKQCSNITTNKDIYTEKETKKKDGTTSTKKIYFCSDKCKQEYNTPKPIIETDYTKLTNWIQQYYINQGWNKKSIPFPLIMSQLKNITDKHKDYNYKSILYVLKYMSDTLSINLLTKESNNSILSLVPYYYNEARDFCLKCAEIRKLAKDFDFSDNVKVVKVGNRKNKYDEMEF